MKKDIRLSNINIFFVSNLKVQTKRSTYFHIAEDEKINSSPCIRKLLHVCLQRGNIKKSSTSKKGTFKYKQS